MKAMLVEVLDHEGDLISRSWFPGTAHIDQEAPDGTISIRCAREDQIEGQPFWSVIHKENRIIHFGVADMEEDEG